MAIFVSFYILLGLLTSLFFVLSLGSCILLSYLGSLLIDIYKANGIQGVLRVVIVQGLNLISYILLGLVVLVTIYVNSLSIVINLDLCLYSPIIKVVFPTIIYIMIYICLFVKSVEIALYHKLNFLYYIGKMSKFFILVWLIYMVVFILLVLISKSVDPAFLDNYFVWMADNTGGSGFGGGSASPGGGNPGGSPGSNDIALNALAMAKGKEVDNSNLYNRNTDALVLDNRNTDALILDNRREIGNSPPPFRTTNTITMSDHRVVEAWGNRRGAVCLERPILPGINTILPSEEDGIFRVLPDGQRVLPEDWVPLPELMSKYVGETPDHLKDPSGPVEETESEHILREGDPWVLDTLAKDLLDQIKAEDPYISQDVTFKYIHTMKDYLGVQYDIAVKKQEISMFRAYHGHPEYGVDLDYGLCYFLDEGGNKIHIKKLTTLLDELIKLRKEGTPFQRDLIALETRHPLLNKYEGGIMHKMQRWADIELLAGEDYAIKQSLDQSIFFDKYYKK